MLGGEAKPILLDIVVVRLWHLIASLDHHHETCMTVSNGSPTRGLCVAGQPAAEAAKLNGGTTAGGSGAAAFRGVGWDAVGGNAAATRQLREMVVLPLLYPEVVSQMGIRVPR